MIDEVKFPGKELFSPARRIGAVMADYMSKHKDFYLFSPDETTSNKLDAVFKYSARAWDLPIHHWDLPESPSGQIVEMLSENALFACMVGHLMNGESAMMTSYESFFTIIASQLQQHLKFLQQSIATTWRKPIPAANLLSTSTCWRQDHNGFTHQSPTLISVLLNNPNRLANCLFPLDDVSAESAFLQMLQSKNVVNLTTFNKIDLPRWIDSHQADTEYAKGGASILQFASDEIPSDREPDYIFASAGDIVSLEALAAIEILRADLPDKKFRAVNISALSYGQIGIAERPLSAKEFRQLFAERCPIIANFHGYPENLRQILSNYTSSTRLHVHGYKEQGSTTTPFEMLSLNRASRYHLALDVAKLEKRDDLVAKYQKILTENSAYAREHGTDLPEVIKIPFQNP